MKKAYQATADEDAWYLDGYLNAWDAHAERTSDWLGPTVAALSMPTKEAMEQARRCDNQPCHQVPAVLAVHPVRAGMAQPAALRLAGLPGSRSCGGGMKRKAGQVITTSTHRHSGVIVGPVRVVHPAIVRLGILIPRQRLADLEAALTADGHTVQLRSEL